MKKLLLASALVFAAASQANAAYFTAGSSYYSTSLKHGQDVKSKGFKLEGGNELISLGYKHQAINFDRSKDIDDLHTLYGIVHHPFDLGDNLSFNAKGGLSLAWEDDFQFSKNYGVFASGSFDYQLDNEWAVEAGAGIAKNKVRSVFFPVLQAKYGDPSLEGLSFVVGFPKNEATYRFTDWFALRGNVQYGDSNYVKLSEHSSYARSGYFYDKLYTATVAAVFTPHPAIEIDAGVAYAFKHEYKFYNSDGELINKYKLDNSCNFFVTGGIKF